jgi:integrase/recombinase XerD
MASLYRKPVLRRDPKTGQMVKGKSKKWWGKYRDQDNQVKRVPLAADKIAAQALLNRLVLKVERQLAGIVDPCERHHKRPLAEHLEDYQSLLENKGSSPDHVKSTIQRVQYIIGECKFDRICQISASRVQECLAMLRSNGRSISSSNHYLRAIKMFSRWLVRDRRTLDDRLAHISSMNEATDRRRIRRPLSMEEFAKLLDAAESGSEIQNVSGPDRAITYIVGIYTGYRRNEIASVTPESFDLDSQPPTLTIQAGYSKRRRRDVIPLRDDFAKRIRDWLGQKGNIASDEPLFNIANKRTAQMIQKDLASAREKWIGEAEGDAELKRRQESSFLQSVDRDGRFVDFHALRMTFITNLSRSGVSPKTAQSLARHSDINLTMNTYTSLGVLDQAAGVEALPPIPVPSKSVAAESVQATGTHGRFGRKTGAKMVPPVVPRGAQNGAHRLASNGVRVAPICTESGAPGQSASVGKDADISEESADSCDDSADLCRVPKEGVEPSRPCGHWILNPARLPFRHFGNDATVLGVFEICNGTGRAFVRRGPNS